MALLPKPVTLTQVASNPQPALDPTPLAIVGAIPVKAQVTALTTVTTADATDLATALVLVNALKVKVNAIITALKA